MEVIYNVIASSKKPIVSFRSSQFLVIIPCIEKLTHQELKEFNGPGNYKIVLDGFRS